MDALHRFFSTLYQFQDLIRWGGLTVLTAIVFAETGLLVGFFFPGDSLLVTAGLLAAVDGVLSIWTLCWVLAVAAVVGDTVGYWIGRSVGTALYNRPDSLLFKREHLEKTHAFYEKHGPKTIVLARFVPIVRTFAPTVAGAARMDYRTFVVYNVVGGVAWVVGMLSLGYFLARSVPGIEKKVHYVILAVIFISFLPILNEWRVSRRAKKAV